MKETIQIWLEDIIQAINEIDGFIPDEMDFIEFKNDVKTRKAVERNIEIIGEAVNRILNINSDIEISNARKIVDTRNRIIHGYNTVSEDIIWSIVSNDLAKLKIEVIALL
ncbi:MAG: DUF86 domain-containing protein [Bacteroidales bacterium]|nr:DUF86 domain-containing protein [Bacteroidales bacterium]